MCLGIPLHSRVCRADLLSSIFNSLYSCYASTHRRFEVFKKYPPPSRQGSIRLVRTSWHVCVCVCVRACVCLYVGVYTYMCSCTVH